MSITPAQSRAARALLGWSQDDLERRSGVAKKTIADFERGARNPHARNRDGLRSALESGGVVFIAENGEGPGVRLRKVAVLLQRARDRRDRIQQALTTDEAREISPVDREIMDKVLADHRSALADAEEEIAAYETDGWALYDPD